MTDHPDSLAGGWMGSVRLPAFEGPLDLLLFLVRRSELDICDIPISLLADQYMEVIASARERQLDVAGEFLVMAATLMRIKSRLLLPPEARGAEEEEASGEDPRWELARMLLEYNRYKEAGGALGDLAERAGERLARVFPDEPEESARLEAFGRFEIWGAYNLVMRRLSSRLREGRIEPETLSVAGRMEELRALLVPGRILLFTELFPGEGPVPPVLVAVSFLALLELTRLGVVKLEQDEGFGDIAILPSAA
jgi:segregation and condensation protein A